MNYVHLEYKRRKWYQDQYNIKVYDRIPNIKYSAIILAVSHDSFKVIEIDKLKFDNNSIVYDIKGFFDKKMVTKRL